MSQLSPSKEAPLPVPAAAKALLCELCEDGAGIRKTWETIQSLAARAELSSESVRKHLRWLALNGYIRHTTVEGGELISVTADGHAQVEVSHHDPMSFKGKVTDGKGEGQYFVSLDGYIRQFRSKLGYEPYSGTLNIDLTTGSTQQLESIPSIPIDAWSNEHSTYGDVCCYPARIETESEFAYESVHVLLPKRTDHDDTIMELIAPVKLRMHNEISTDTQIIVHV